jgi:hypothetical protein
MWGIMPQQAGGRLSEDQMPSFCRFENCQNVKVCPEHDHAFSGLSFIPFAFIL